MRESWYMTMQCVYIGNLAKVAEYICFKDRLNLCSIICENDRVTDELLTFSLLRNVPILKVDNEHLIEDYFNRFSEDTVFIMCSYGRRVPVERCSHYKIYNIHYAALPAYKGRHPSYWATVNNEKQLGVSIHIVNEKFDEGDIVAQTLVPYYFWENEKDIFEKLTNQVPNLLDKLINYLQGQGILIKNNSGTYYAPVTLEDITLNLEQDEPALLFNKVRSQSRANGAVVVIDKKKYRLFDICFTEQQVDCSGIKDGKLYIRYKPDISIYSTKYKEEI